jgi:hypothetical protein
MYNVCVTQIYIFKCIFISVATTTALRLLHIENNYLRPSTEPYIGVTVYARVHFDK